MLPYGFLNQFIEFHERQAHDVIIIAFNPLDEEATEIVLNAVRSRLIERFILPHVEFYFFAAEFSEFHGSFFITEFFDTCVKINHVDSRINDMRSSAEQFKKSWASFKLRGLFSILFPRTTIVSAEIIIFLS